MDSGNHHYQIEWLEGEEIRYFTCVSCCTFHAMLRWIRAFGFETESPPACAIKRVQWP